LTVTTDLTVDTDTLYVDSTNNLVGIGTSSPGVTLDVNGGSTTQLRLTAADSTSASIINFGDQANVAVGRIIYSHVNDSFSFKTNNVNDRLIIDSSGNVGIGTSSPAQKIHAQDSSGTTIIAERTGANAGFSGIYGSNNPAVVWGGSSDSLRFAQIDDTSFTNFTERMRLDASGNLLVGKTSSSLGTNGVELRDGTSYITNTSASPLAINREGTDGQLVGFYNDEVAAGAINVSGGTVSYTAFMGSHYSETADSNILFGTVMEATGDLVENEYTAQERLTKTQVSTTSESAAVYGVWIGAMEGGGETIAAVGASWCRINSSATIAVGDLLTSNGDGTAKVQSDDIIRSKTIGKVTSTTIKETHADGSYVVPVVLYCG
jgi:hypothetical protein